MTKQSAMSGTEPAGTQASSPAKTIKGLFGGGKVVTEHHPRAVVIDYREGLEKSVRQSVKSDMVDVARNMGWGKKGVTAHLSKVQGHPKLDDGYIYEVQMNGDGGSYIPEVLERLKSPDVHQVWIQCSKDWAFVECKNGKLETSFSPLAPEAGDVVASLSGKPQDMAPLFLESYAFFYVSLVMFIMSALSFPIAAAFKHLWLNESQVMIDKNYYTKDKFMPIPAIRAVFSEYIGSSKRRLGAIRYSPSKGWSVISEEMDGDNITQYEQKIAPDGSLSERVQIKEGDSAAPAKPSKENVVPEKTAGNKVEKGN